MSFSQRKEVTTRIKIKTIFCQFSRARRQFRVNFFYVMHIIPGANLARWWSHGRNTCIVYTSNSINSSSSNSSSSSSSSSFCLYRIYPWFFLSGGGCLWVMNVEAHAAHFRMASTITRNGCGHQHCYLIFISLSTSWESVTLPPYLYRTCAPAHVSGGKISVVPQVGTIFWSAKNDCTTEC